MCILKGFYMGPINKTPIKNILKNIYYGPYKGHPYNTYKIYLKNIFLYMFFYECFYYGPI